MTGVLSGFFIVWCLIAIGWIVGRTGVLGEQGRFVLNRTTFFLASPCLVLTSLLESDLGQVLSTPMLIAGVSGLVSGGLLLLIVRLLTKRRGAELVVTAISGSVVNGANMGFPIAAYVLGDTSHALPVILFQQAIYTPLYLFVLHAVTTKMRPSPAGVLRNIASNPTIVAAVVGIVLVVCGVKLPEVILQPFGSIADMAIPAMLLAYGISLIGSAPLAKDDGYRGLIAIATAFKLAVMPLIALGLGMLLGLGGHDLFAVVVMAALPTAQNVFVAASQYKAAENLARDTVLLTTVGTVITLLIVSGVMSA
ncbi:AEC family transporter [Brachybacterium halotolerans subsp. kimchii]|uniref:AEC family transporter n=1 Tax=Brachybacterium halotolerans TaxID=2795215 RepID=UPI001E305AA5|nr:AEC family transporter [Brachybacterium halotolerans]UEJ83510.1 AEC family transporter [Brachybacterium halotolerans subsp. kimchii]